MLGEDTSVSDGLVAKLAPGKAINERVQRTGIEEACVGVQVNPSMTKSVVFAPGLVILTQRVRLNRIHSQISRNSVCLVLRVSNRTQRVQLPLWCAVLLYASRNFERNRFWTLFLLCLEFCSASGETTIDVVWHCVAPFIRFIEWPPRMWNSDR